MFIELHIIQNFAPANLNRDDANNPKDCEFGGVRRARISSQCIKRAIRTWPVFAETTRVEPGTRTRWLMRLLHERLLGTGKQLGEIDAVLTAFVQQYASKLDKDGQRTAVLLYFSQTEIDRLVQALLEHWDELGDEASLARLAKQLVKEHQGQSSAPDIALFGRMLAEQPELNLEAACQVAHAISTHRVTMEMDFFTAVDDLQEQAEPGAGMMGFTGFNSACFYRYARLDWRQLLGNLDGDVHLARRTVEGFLRAAIEAVPTGKQNTFAAQNPPSFLLGVVRDNGMSWSLANAFEQPVLARRDSGLVRPSVSALDSYWGCLCQVYGTETLRCVAALPLEAELPLAHLAENQASDLQSWMGAILEALPAQEESA